MSVLNALRETATKLGLLRIITIGDEARPTRLATRTISLKELTLELREADVQALAAASSEFSVPYEQVFEAAGIKPVPCDGGEEHWTIDTLHQMVMSAAYRELAREKAQSAILAMLAGKKLAVADLVKDAMARDRAIDAFGAQVCQQRQAGRRARAQQKAALEDQIAALQQQVERLEKEGRAADQQWQDWWQRKVEYERRMAHALGYLLPDPIVTVDAQAPPDDNLD